MKTVYDNTKFIEWYEGEEQVSRDRGAVRLGIRISV